MEVIHIKLVSGLSKSISSLLPYKAVLIKLLIQKENTDVITIKMRITKSISIIRFALRELLPIIK